MSRGYKILFLLILYLSVVSESILFATHIRAGEINAERISTSSLKYRFTFVGYRDSGDNNQVIFGNGFIDFGDGSEPITLGELAEAQVTEVSDNTEKWVFIWEYTYAGAPGTYTISYRERDRNHDIRNIAEFTPFYIETQFEARNSLGLNQTPSLFVPPIDFGCVGVAFIHNPGAFDPEGDSISYSLQVPLQSKGVEVSSYRPPDENNLEFYPDGHFDELGNTPATLSIDPITGDLVWDAPGVEGEFNVAMRITEWREFNGTFRQIGYVVRDMQILIEDNCQNERPEIEVPLDTCVVAGTRLIEEITGSDPDGDPILLEAFSGIFEYEQSFLRASFVQTQATVGEFDWQTDCAHVRLRPYTVQFKVSDDPSGRFGADVPPSLVDFKTWNITVVGPAPELVQAVALPGRSIDLNWNEYDCKDQADSMEIWRRVGSFDFDPAGCELGIPENSGYELIKSLPISDTSYKDDNDGEGLSPGANYCYRLLAIFELASGRSESYASNEICVNILADAPIMTNVSVEKTSETDGEIFVRWAAPFEIDEINFPPPFKYDVYRSVISDEGQGVPVVLSTSDTSYVDMGLNTKNTIYSYQVFLFDANGDSVDVSARASSVRLEPSPGFESITLNWTAEVPWSNSSTEYPMHYIYRDSVLMNFPDSLVLMDSVDVIVNGFTYIDDGSKIGIPLLDAVEYCYFVTTLGSYGNDGIIAPLINRSQIICAQSNDTIPPCMPLNFNVSPPDGLDCESIGCSNDLYTNNLSWSVNTLDTCGNDIRNYNIYYSNVGIEGPYEIVGTSVDTIFSHSNLKSFAGCYKVSAVDRSGNESPISETFCVENCFFYELPNVFTPDNDPEDKNNVFRPFPCPRFVETVNFKVFNRHGKEVYTFASDEPESTIQIDWNGFGNNGSLLASGVYYYVADVTFDTFDPALRQQQITGWVHILY